MFKKLLIASLAIGALGLQAPAALASHAVYDCGYNAVAQETATGGQDTYTGAAYGYVASPTPGEAVTIRCYVTVDGTDVSSTGTGSGTQFATTSGQVTYTATDDQDVKLCAQWTAGNEGGTECFETTNTQIPPQEVIDALEPVFDLTGLPDFLLCPILAGLAPGIPGVVDIDTTGDVAIAGTPFWDCPPYAEG